MDTMTAATNPPMKSFDVLGYLSADVEEKRRSIRRRHETEFARVEALVERAFGDLKAVSGTAAEGYLLGLGFWLRCLECCQGAVLLIERGLPSAPVPPLRTALECLLFACALWRKPELAQRLQEGHDAERVKQAREMLKAGAARVPPARLAALEAVANETAPTAGLTAWEAACAADLVHEYQTAYRGFGIAGAHASLRSLDDFIVVHADGSIDLNLGPEPQRTEWLLGLVATFLTCGIHRLHDARSRSQPAATNSTGP